MITEGTIDYAQLVDTAGANPGGCGFFSNVYGQRLFWGKF